jgi:ATP-dependent DNA ligase
MRSGIMLAQPFEEKRLAKWGQGPFIIQPKLDGDRCRAVIDGSGNVTLYSSEENIITSVPHINDQLQSLKLHDIEFDGELYVHDSPFEYIHSIVSRKVNQHYNSEVMQFHIFDVITTDPQVARLRAVSMLLEKDINIHLDSVSAVPWDYVVDLPSIMESMSKYRNSGYEGIILRHPHAPYVRKRSPFMMKFKPKKNDIYKIVGFQEEISIHGVPKNSLGALILQGDDTSTFAVGSGFDALQRAMYWKVKETLIGKWCEVQYQHITTKNKVPRFPIFSQIREDFI